MITAKPLGKKLFGVLLSLPVLFMACGEPTQQVSADPNADYSWNYVVVEPGTHPGIMFSEQELPALRERAAGEGLAADAYANVKEASRREFEADISVEQAVHREGHRLSRQLECMALVYQIEGDDQMGRRAIELLEAIATGIDPWAFYKEVDSDFFATEHWPKAFAFAWDWTCNLMTPAERERILAGLEEWSEALYDHTESWWWREASYNCGAIPVGAHGILLAAIQGETNHPDFQQWFDDAWRKCTMNYFPLTWRDNGICSEGPGYAHYHKNPTQFLEAVRRTGGPDKISETGAVNAMHWLRHQWMPCGGCGPVADNTEYGRRVFQSIYLHGIRELGDAAGLWTFETFADRERFNDVLAFLLYPDGLTPVSPGEEDRRTSYYFEIDYDRAGHVFARSEWDSDQAHWFVFTTQYESHNHTHTDMNSFLFTAFGEPFATHENLFGYSHEHHGADIEHNIVIIDNGGIPKYDRSGTAGDDGDLNGYLTGVACGHFADYVRGDARNCYADRSDPSSTGAVRAERTMIFVKQGPNPYIVVADDIQKDGFEHDYHWQWYTEEQEIYGAGTFDEPFLLRGEHSNCAIAFLEPVEPEYDFEVIRGGSRRHPIELGLLRVNRCGVRERFIAVAAAWAEGDTQPNLKPGPLVNGNPDAVSITVEGKGYRDIVVWQPEEQVDAHGKDISCAGLATDGIMAIVRTDDDGNVTGYVLGDGRKLEYAGRTLADSHRRMSVTADGKRAFARGPRRARQGLPPLPALGRFWLPSQETEVWVDNERVEEVMARDRMVIVDAASEGRE